MTLSPQEVKAREECFKALKAIPSKLRSSKQKKDFSKLRDFFRSRKPSIHNSAISTQLYHQRKASKNTPLSSTNAYNSRAHRARQVVAQREELTAAQTAGEGCSYRGVAAGVGGVKSQLQNLIANGIRMKVNYSGLVAKGAEKEMSR